MLENLLLFLVFFPFAAGLLVYAVGKSAENAAAPVKAVAGKPLAKEGVGICRAARVIAVLCMLAESIPLFVLLTLFVMRSQVNLLSLYPEDTASMTLLASVPELCGFGLHFVMDGFRVIYAAIAGLMWLGTCLLSGEYFEHHENVPRFYLFLFLTMGATLGVFLSADLYTTFIFFEIMSFTSYVWVAQEENRPSLRAAETYLAVAVIGGLVMLMGIFLLYFQLGTLDIEGLRTAVQNASDKSVIFAAGLCMLVGFGAKAGAFPLHIWLPKAHPVAPAPASALLSGILTKTGIYGVLILSCNLFLYDKTWGALILTLGVITMFGGALLAVFSVDLKRTLACSSMSQIGFILVGVGMQGLLGEENALAVHGTFLHMLNHSLIKLVLFMAAGVIYMNAHALELNEIRGYGRRKPLLKAIFLTGALAIGGIPLFGGYVSKTLLHEAIVEYGAETGSGIITAVEWIFLFSGGLTVAYMTKLYAAIFVEKNNDEKKQKTFDEQKKYMKAPSAIALAGSALILFLWGLVPGFTMDKAAELSQSFMKLTEFGHRVHYFSLGNLKGAAVSIVIGAAVYAGFIRTCLLRKTAVVNGDVPETGKKAPTRYINAWPEWLDLENMLYRPLLLSILPIFFGILCRIPDSLVDTIVVLLRKTLYKDSPLPMENTRGSKLLIRLGRLLNGLQELRLSLRFIGSREKKAAAPRRDYVQLLLDRNEEFKENNRIVERSLSFGLMLFGVGLILMFVYLLWI